MSRVKVRRVGEGLHPSEVVVEITTADGARERLVVDKRSLRDDTLGIGYPLSKQKDNVLVELPRETTEGLWRVWVKKDEVLEEVDA
jgi:hypothetical protein